MYNIMKTLKQFFSRGLAKGFSLFTTSKRHKRRRNKTRRNKRRNLIRRTMRGG